MCIVELEALPNRFNEVCLNLVLLHNYLFFKYTNLIKYIWIC